MEQCWALAGMESAVLLRAGRGGLGCAMPLGRGGGGGLGLRVECAANFNRFKTPNSQRSSSSSSKAEDEANKKRAPVRLPGGRQLPTYGKNASLQKSNPGLGQFKPPQLFGGLCLSTSVQDIVIEFRMLSDAWGEWAYVVLWSWVVFEHHDGMVKDVFLDVGLLKYGC